MGNNVRLFMMPVCICGHIFRDLRLVSDEPPALDPSFAIAFPVRHSHFEPTCCPNCGRIIETVLVKDLKPDETGEIIFIDKDCRPEFS